MSYRGQFAAHVSNTKSKIFGASPRAEMAMTCNMSGSPSKNVKSAWNLIKNEDDGGVNPYAGGFEENSGTKRKRNTMKEEILHQAPFIATTKTSSARETKVQVNSLNNLHSMQMAQLLSVSMKDPAPILISNKSSAIASPNRIL